MATAQAGSAYAQEDTGDPAADKGQQSRWCVGIAPDPGRGQVYWTQKGGDNAGEGVIRRCGLHMPQGARANSEVRVSAYGVLKLTLRNRDYEWDFIEANTARVRDHDAGACH